MFVRESGPADAPAILFLHGNGSSGLMWKEHMERLTDFYCLAPDMPGFGCSGDREWVSLEETAREVADLLRSRLRDARAHVVGLSLGGSTALTLLGRTPDRIDRAIIDGAGVLPVAGLGFLKVGLRILQPFLHTNVVTRTIARTMNIPEGGYEEFRQGMLASSRSSFTRSFLQSLTMGQPPGLENVTRPVLFVAGEREPEAVRASNAMLAHKLPHGECRVAPAMGHGWLAEAPDLHTEMVRAWVSGRPLPLELHGCAL